MCSQLIGRGAAKLSADWEISRCFRFRDGKERCGAAARPGRMGWRAVQPAGNCADEGLRPQLLMRILIAEDDPYSLKILQLMLKSEPGYELVGVTDGEAAWRELESGLGFNLCILDIMMPNLDGLELAARIRQTPRLRHQAIIFCTALNDRQTIDQAAALGISHYIVKPYAREHVLRQVRRIADETPSSLHFEPQSAVIARLGLGAGELRLLLRELHDDIAAFIAAGGGGTLDTLRVNALKGAAVNLGCRALSVRLAQIESLGGGTAENPSLRVGFLALETELERLRGHLGLVPRPAALAQAVAPEPAPRPKRSQRQGADESPGGAARARAERARGVQSGR